MATWDVEDLVKEISDMEAIYQRNAGSQLVPRMQEALQSKVNGVQMLAASNFLKRPDAVQNGILTADTKAELQAFLESRAASSIQGATRLQATPQSMTTPWNYLVPKRMAADAEWHQHSWCYPHADQKNQSVWVEKPQRRHQEVLDILFGQPSGEITNVLPPVFDMYKFCAGYVRGCGGSTSACWFGKVPT